MVVAVAMVSKNSLCSLPQQLAKLTGSYQNALSMKRHLLLAHTKRYRSVANEPRLAGKVLDAFFAEVAVIYVVETRNVRVSRCLYSRPAKAGPRCGGMRIKRGKSDSVVGKVVQGLAQGC